MCSLSINIPENGVNEQTSVCQEETQTDQQPREAPGKETDRKHTQRWEQVCSCAIEVNGFFINSVLSEGVCVCVSVSEMAGEVFLASLLFLSATVPCFSVYSSGECFFNTKGENIHVLNLICNHIDYSGYNYCFNFVIFKNSL